MIKKGDDLHNTPMVLWLKGNSIHYTPASFTSNYAKLDTSVDKIYPIMMHLKMMYSHIAICVITYFGFAVIAINSDASNMKLIGMFYLATAIFFYVLSGYLQTRKSENFSLKNYFIIAFIGLIIWMIAFVGSPNELEWTAENNGYWWLVYRIFTSALETPINMINGASILFKNIKYQMVVLLFLSIVPSILQAFGGYLRVLKNDRIVSDKL